jgi:cell division protein FtsI (penicillin-binding protein 3)
MAESTEPGSTFKLASLISAMDDGFVNPQDTINIEGGTKQYYDRVIRDTHFNGISKVTVQRAFEISSNVGISKIIQKHYAKNPQAFVDKLYSMNLNKPLILQLAGEASPRIKSTKDKDWSGTSLPYMSIGYEVRLTPMQLLTFYNAVANNGKMLKPLFVKEIQQEGKVVKQFEPIVIKDSICSIKTIRKAQKLLEGVVQNGTARNLKNASYHIAGKTGTAQIAYGVTGYKDSTVRYQASFVGYFPAENPKYTCIVVVNAPSNDVYYAAEVAGPIFKEIADKVYATRLDIHKEFKEEYAVINTTAPAARIGNQQDYTTVYKQLGYELKNNNESSMWGIPQVKMAVVTIKETHTIAGKVPNVIGMGIKDALYVLENAGLKVKINGKGKVVGQSITSGSPTPKGSSITIQLG